MFRGDGVTAHSADDPLRQPKAAVCRNVEPFRFANVKHKFHINMEMAVHIGEHALIVLVKAATTAAAVVKKRRQNLHILGRWLGLVVVFQWLYIGVHTLRTHIACTN